MKRRQFLLGSAVASSLTLAPSIASASAPKRFALAHRAPHATAWCEASQRPAARCSPWIRLTLDEVGTATVADHPLRRFDVELMYRLAAGGDPYAGYRWARQSRGEVFDKSRSMSLVLGADQIAALRVTYVFADGGEQVETLALTDAVTPLAATGSYALIGPDRGGSRARTLGDSHADRDVVRFRVEAA